MDPSEKQSSARSQQRRQVRHSRKACRSTDSTSEFLDFSYTSPQSSPVHRSRGYRRRELDRREDYGHDDEFDDLEFSGDARYQNPKPAERRDGQSRLQPLSAASLATLSRDLEQPRRDPDIVRQRQRRKRIVDCTNGSPRRHRDRHRRDHVVQKTSHRRKAYASTADDSRRDYAYDEKVPHVYERDSRQSSIDDYVPPDRKRRRKKLSMIDFRCEPTRLLMPCSLCSACSWRLSHCGNRAWRDIVQEEIERVESNRHVQRW